jgi:hypothetical protein
VEKILSFREPVLRNIAPLPLHLAWTLNGEDFVFSEMSPGKHSLSTFALSLDPKWRRFGLFGNESRET